MSRERIDEITILRAFAFLAIVMQHCIAEYIYRPDILPPDEIMLAMLFHFTRFGTPTFVFMSGVILLYNYADKLDYFTYLKKRTRDILVPFLCWTLVYWAAVSGFIADYSFADASTWRELGRQFVQPTYGYHLWFILMIFQFYILLPLFVRLGNAVMPWAAARTGGSARRRSFRMLAAAGAAYAALLWFSYYKAPALVGGVSNIWQWLLQHRGQWFVSYFYYFLLGAVCAYGLAGWRKAVLGTWFWGGFAFIALYIWIGYELLGLSMDEMKLSYSTYLRPTTFFLIVAQLWTVYGIALLLEQHGGLLRRLLTFIGRHSFGGFLAHAFVLMLIAQITRPLELAGYHLPAAALTFAGTAAGAVGLSWLLSTVPYGWLLAGAQGRKKIKKTAGGHLPPTVSQMHERSM